MKLLSLIPLLLLTCDPCNTDIDLPALNPDDQIVKHFVL